MTGTASPKPGSAGTAPAPAGAAELFSPEGAHRLAAAVAERSAHLIDGALVEGTVAARVTAPWDRARSVDYRAVDADGMLEAVTAAAAAFRAGKDDPSGLGSAERRAEVLLAMADRAEAIADELAAIIAFENGKLLRSATMEAGAVAGSFRYWAGVTPETEVLASTGTHTTELVRRPLGVVAAITPFNMPVLMMANKIGAALATGNTLVGKPSPATPLSLMRLAEAIAEVVPAGWVNLVAGDDASGPALSSSPDVAIVSFTGSVPVGKAIMRSAAANLTRVQLELGGNDPAIVGPGADLDEVVPLIYRSAFGSSGQACVAAKRVYAHESIADEVTARLVELASSARVGHPFDPDATVPVLTTEAQFDTIDRLITEASADAELAFAGERTKATAFVAHPTIVAGARSGMAVVDEEQFGPVLPVIPFATAAEVIELANATPFGLGATVWSRDDAFLAKVVPGIESGMVWVNGLGMPSPAVPFGGAKQSGIGREGGKPGIDAFTELVTVTRFVPAGEQAKP
ncbi:phenylacetaldehyde dehydrogenase [Pseudoclavibacter endophyticus]|uniref:Aldehyde dehydrogenase family protein n=1 Tax=Pseudoclavibacter endophyticus TaxID=1778590 RepID=A0A6H9WAI9_9MICO|nr:aldehyde dehydrogenase family protein [Pseudoclavibacter endophyticus]KAB1646847.1 aldehyde dehydrogenase family protein [Pseudoclavibacter endophyticus]GGA75059.1 phenylacetaldehyde dehydrogenase [Pseudoclavibacter endophyticus]